MHAYLKVNTERIYASSVGFTDIPAKVFQKMTSLLNLELSISKITTLVPGTFFGLTALTSLMLTANEEWVTIEDGAMDGMDKLTDLLFRSNPQLILPRFDRMPSLRKLTVANCDAIVTVPQGVFSRLDVIEEAVFEHNARLANIPKGAFTAAASLQKLDITGATSLVGLEAGSFEGLDGLLAMSIVACGLVAVNEFDFSGLTSLNSMYLGDLESLVSIAPLALSTLTSLQNLRIAKAQRLAVLPRLDGLFSQSVDGGDLEQQRRVWLGTFKQSSIIVEDLGLTDLSFLRTTKLHVVRLDVKCMPGVKVVQQNVFEMIAASCSILKLNGNGITKIETNAFAGLHKLADLEIRGNAALKWLAPGAFNDAFDHQTESVRIDLQKNGLRVISPDTITFDASWLAAPKSTIISVSSAAGTHLDVCCSYEWLALDPHWSFRGLYCNNTRAHEQFSSSTAAAAAASDEANNIDGGASGGETGAETRAGAGVEAEADDGPATIATTDAADVVPIAELDFQYFGCCFQPLGWRQNLNAIESQKLGGLSFGGTKQAGSLRDLDPQVQRHLNNFCANASWSVQSDRLLDSTCTSGEDFDEDLTKSIINTGTSAGAIFMPANNNANARANNTGAAAAASTADMLAGCPSLDAQFKQVWSPETQQCLTESCPEGFRKEYIGKRHLVDCEPWFHADRAYITRFVLGEMQCIQCSVLDCAVCNDNDFRACSQCIAGHSLLKELSADGTSVEHTCVERCSEHDRYSFDGECVPLTECRQREEVEAEATESTDRSCSERMDATAAYAAIGVILFLVCVAAVYAFYQGHDRRRRIGMARKAAEQSNGATKIELTDGLFAAVEFGELGLVPALIKLGADASVRDSSGQLPHATALRHQLQLDNDVHLAALQALFHAHCEFDAQIGTFIKSNSDGSTSSDYALVEHVVSELARSAWRSPLTGNTVAHVILEGCYKLTLAEKQTVRLMQAVLLHDATILTTANERGKTPTDVAIMCEDMIEIQTRFTVVLFNRYQIVRPQHPLYKSPTAEVHECNDLTQLRNMKHNSNSDARYAIKLMANPDLWLRELQTRDTLGSEATDSYVGATSAAIVETEFAAAQAAMQYAMSASSEARPVSVFKPSFVTENRRDEARLLMTEYPYAIQMRLADRNLHDIISYERLAEQPLDVIRRSSREVLNLINDLHNGGVVHGDVKPNNVVRVDRTLMLIDLDMSITIGSSEPPAHSNPEKFGGSSAYAAPELHQWMAERKGDDAVVKALFNSSCNEKGAITMSALASLLRPGTTANDAENDPTILVKTKT